MTHSELLAGRPNVPGLGGSDCPGELVLAHALDDSDAALRVEILICQDCGVRISRMPFDGKILNVYQLAELAPSRFLEDR